MSSLALTEMDRGLVSVVSSIEGLVDYDGLVRCEFRIPRLSAWALLYPNRSALIRDSLELELRPGAYGVRSISLHRFPVGGRHWERRASPGAFQVSPPSYDLHVSVSVRGFSTVRASNRSRKCPE